jgi:nucleoside-diphosphate-sugar epimerase
MRIFVAGATGAVGKRLVPLLAANGHEVVGTTRSAERTEAIRAMGAEPAVLDVLDRDGVMAAVVRAEPEVVVHQATAISNLRSMRNVDRVFADTNRLRTEGTDHLLEAARAAGARRLVAQSYAGWPYARTGGPVKTEEDPLDANPPASFRRTLEAIRHLETTVTGAGDIEGVVVRYGGLYGPGTSFEPGAEHYRMLMRRQFPIVGSGAGVWSFLHIDDAASATMAAIETGAPGIYNVVDDEPAPVSEWLPEVARIIGAKPPRRVPAWLGRVVGGEAAISMMTEIRGASNAKFKRELGWSPTWATWRDGFRRGLDVPLPAGQRDAR